MNKKKLNQKYDIQSKHKEFQSKITLKKVIRRLLSIISNIVLH